MTDARNDVLARDAPPSATPTSQSHAVEAGRFAGRVAVVTGSAAGMGRAHVASFAREGADIAASDRADATKTIALIEHLGGRGFQHPLDVADEASVSTFTEAVEVRFGRVNILVNNAGIYPFERFDDMTFGSWRHGMAVDLEGPFVPGMRRRGWGRVVNIALAEAWMVAANNLHYIATKMGVIGLTRALATEVAESGITVNAIAPGIVAGTSIDADNPSYLEDIPRLFQAIKRPATPDDIVAALVFFASEDASFITGQTLVVDGGAVRV
ncbi:MAG: SDR family NAD(P)-dependent oxidoreductase [Hyphomicrobium sp.]